VVAFARTPSKLEMEDARLSVVQGDVTDPDPVFETISGVDAVLSALGPPRGVPAGVMEEGLNNILAAMREHGVRRLLVVVGAGVGDPQDRPTLLDRVIGGVLWFVSREFYEEMVDLAATVRACDLDWTLVRVPMLTDEPGTGDVRVGYLGVDAGTRLSREDLARFMVEQVDQETYVRQAPVISN
jgi:putative NADH-flavin reductase